MAAAPSSSPNQPPSRCAPLRYFPEDERFLYLSDEGGNELDHLYVRELDGSIKDLTPGENLKATFFGFAHDGQSFFAMTNERDPRMFDVYEYDAKTYERSMIFQNDEAYQPSAISRDKRYIALDKVVHNADSNIYLLDRESGEATLITEHEGDANHNAMDFTPDGTGLLFTTDENAEFAYLARHDLASGAKEVLMQRDWDIMFAGYSHSGRYLGVGINNDSRTELVVLDTESGEAIDLPELPQADITQLTISSDDSMLAFYASSSRMPRDLFVMPVGGEPQQLTRSLNPAINADHLVEGKVVRFDSFDGTVIPGILYKPHQANDVAKVPALVWVHGGPGGQSRLGYSALLQYLVNHGYAVYAINNRGSSGYGKTFFHMDDRAHGKGDLDDVVHSKTMLIGTGWVDPNRIGVLGGSYGGYMVLAALTFRPEAFDVGVNIFGVSNWVRTLQSIPPWWESFRAYLEKEMGDFDDTEYLTSISPLFHAENIVRPLIVLQGANDPRVLKVESDEIVEAVKANGVPVEYVVFDDEGHGFRKKENQSRGYEAILKFLDEHLKGAQ